MQSRGNMWNSLILCFSYYCCDKTRGHHMYKYECCLKVNINSLQNERSEKIQGDFSVIPRVALSAN